jgi:hypothetical protein
MPGRAGGAGPPLVPPAGLRKWIKLSMVLVFKDYANQNDAVSSYSASGGLL